MVRTQHEVLQTFQLLEKRIIYSQIHHQVIHAKMQNRYAKRLIEHDGSDVQTSPMLA
jgi:hypothetical protein